MKERLDTDNIKQFWQLYSPLHHTRPIESTIIYAYGRICATLDLFQITQNGLRCSALSLNHIIATQ